MVSCIFVFLLVLVYALIIQRNLLSVECTAKRKNAPRRSIAPLRDGMIIDWNTGCL